MRCTFINAKIDMYRYIYEAAKGNIKKKGQNSMELYSWILLIVSAIYGSLTVYAGVVGLRDKESSRTSDILMIIGGALILIAVIPEALEDYQLILLIPGLIIIHIAAIINGIKIYGKITIRHNINKIFLSALIILLYFIK